MNLIETKIYKLQVGLFIHKFNEKSGMCGIGKMLLEGSEVMYDQNADGWHIFHVLGHPGTYVKVPDYDLDNEIEELDSERYKELSE